MLGGTGDVVFCRSCSRIGCCIVCCTAADHGMVDHEAEGVNGLDHAAFEGLFPSASGSTFRRVPLKLMIMIVVPINVL